LKKLKPRRHQSHRSFSDSTQQVIDRPIIKDELLQPHDKEMSVTEIPEILDVNEERHGMYYAN
jgi:hypothetical protein